MSRRRKYGDSTATKNTPRRRAATEDCSSVVEQPGSRRLRSAPGSVLGVAGEGPSWPRQQEQRPAPASCINSNPEERYETPSRVLKMDLLSCTFSSPNDPDGQNDIFWDQNSPVTKQLGKGRKKQIYTTDSDEISDIVNRIAPQDEKPTTDSMLDMWIGAAAIPCTPSVAKEKSRVKISRTKLKTKNQEKELMKLAKQFDKNMEELDVIQEQNKKNCDFIQAISEAETSHNYNDYVQMHPLHDVVPKIDNAVIKKPMKGNTRISVANDQNSSQKPFDQNAEAAFNAIFDGSTQKCSGQLSQDLSDAFLNTSKNALKEEKIITNGTLVTGKLPSKTQDSLYPRVDSPRMTKSCVTPYSKEQEASSKHIGTITYSDFEDDWERLLSNEAFVMQNVEMLEHFPSKTSQVTDHKETYNFISKNDESTSRINKSLDAKLGDSKVLQDFPSKIHNRELVDAGKYRFSSNQNDKSSKLSPTRNKMKSLHKIVIQDKTQDCAVASNLTKLKEDICINFTSNVNTSEKMSSLNTKHSSEQKNKPIFDQSFKAPVNIDPFGSSTLDCKTIVNKPDHTNASKLGSFFDDWNDPSLASEIIKTCHQLETSWEADNVDDDLLYQACDDIERLTQQQDILRDSKTSESILEINNSSKHGVKNISTISKQGSQLAQSNHLNLGSITMQISSLTDSTQINKSVKMEKRDMSGNSPEILGTTTNLTMYSKNSNCQMNNLHVSGNNSDVPIQVYSSKSVLAVSSSLNVSSNYMNTVIASNTEKLNTRQLSHVPQTNEAQSGFNKAVRFSKYTFTKAKNPQVLCQLNQNCIERSMSTTKITQGLEKKKTVNSILGEADQQKSLVKTSESLKQSSKEEEEKNRKYSPEEIQRKRQEALVRRMAKAQASSVNSAPT